MSTMSRVAADLVEIVREFLTAHQLLRRLVARYRRDELQFEELHELVSDDEESVLFRLKEKSHALFRPAGGRVGNARPGEVLLDLAVGSLFHEAMKFRESFYQREVYGPRVRALRAEAGEEADGFFLEFEKILSLVSERLEEGLQETEALIDQTAQQLRRLITAQAENGFLTRFLIERTELVEAVYTEGLDALLTDIHGDPKLGFSRAAESYLASGYYGEAEEALLEAERRGSDAAATRGMAAYACGMSAYLAGRYAESVDRLGDWLDAAATPDPALARQAHAAVSRIGQLVDGPERQTVVDAAALLLERIDGN